MKQLSKSKIIHDFNTTIKPKIKKITIQFLEWLKTKKHYSLSNSKYYYYNSHSLINQNAILLLKVYKLNYLTFEKSEILTQFNNVVNQLKDLTIKQAILLLSLDKELTYYDLHDYKTRYKSNKKNQFIQEELEKEKLKNNTQKFKHIIGD